MLSIIVPTLNEGERLTESVQSLQTFRQRGAEIIVVDGGSNDGSIGKISSQCDAILSSPKGRAIQMNAGAQHANGQHLLFLHADTSLPPNADKLVHGALANGDWGRFDIQMSNALLPYRVIAWFINCRSRYTKVATGDQALFFHKKFFEQIGGFPSIPLMEDVAISKKARRHGRYQALKDRVLTSARRWEQHGIIKTILLMWELRLRYFLGQSPTSLAKRYYG